MRLLEERTGRSAEAWAAVTRKDGPAGAVARREWLKTTHGFSTNYAWWIADLSLGQGLADLDAGAYLEAAEGYVEAMFSGARAALRPVYDRLLCSGSRSAPTSRPARGRPSSPFTARTCSRN